MAITTFEDQVEAVKTLTGMAPVFGGGGRGQTAKADFTSGGHTTEWVGKGTSKAAALADLYRQVVDDMAIKPEPKPKAPDRLTVEDALDVLGRLFGEFDVDEEDDDRTPGPVWKGTTLVRVVPCVGECMGASPSSPCDCRCGGSNHAIGGAFMFGVFEAAIKADDKAEFKKALAAARPTRLGPKECLCGCGGITQRRFVPGHDARYHAAIKRAAKEREAASSAGA